MSTCCDGGRGRQDLYAPPLSPTHGRESERREGVMVRGTWEGGGNASKHMGLTCCTEFIRDGPSADFGGTVPSAS
jgi:hypothetical protein